MLIINLDTFEKVSRESGLVDRPVGDELHPQCVRGGAHVFGLVVAAKTTDEGARLQGAVPDLQVVVGAAVVPLDLQKDERLLAFHGFARWFEHKLVHVSDY